MDELRDALRDEAKRLVIDATYASRGHFAAAAEWSSRAVWFGTPVAILSGLSASAAAAAIVAQNPALGAFLAIASAVLTAVRGFLRPDELAKEHGAKANQYVALRNDGRFFLEIDLGAAHPLDVLRSQLRRLRDDYNRLITTPPHTVSRKNYETARRQIESGEANYINDPLWKELDH